MARHDALERSPNGVAAARLSADELGMEEADEEPTLSHYYARIPDPETQFGHTRL